MAKIHEIKKLSAYVGGYCNNINEVFHFFCKDTSKFWRTCSKSWKQQF